jgi:hypothetical protein
MCHPKKKDVINKPTAVIQRLIEFSSTQDNKIQINGPLPTITTEDFPYLKNRRKTLQDRRDESKRTTKNSDWSTQTSSLSTA